MNIPNYMRESDYYGLLDNLYHDLFDEGYESIDFYDKRNHPNKAIQDVICYAVTDYVADADVYRPERDLGSYQYQELQTHLYDALYERFNNVGL